jgi:uncharacterized protein YbjT (DUF2867 family)
MVAYAFAAQFPEATERLVLMDAFLPGIGNWKDVWLMRDLWHFHFYGEVPLKLVEGRERIYFEHFWNDFAADPKHSVSEADRRIYAEAYAQPGGMRAGFEYFKNFERDAVDFARLSATKLSMPVLVLTGEKASGPGLIEQARLVASNVKGVIVQSSGHWLMDEAPDQVIPQLVGFLDDSGTGPAAAGAGSRRRLTLRETDALPQIAPGAGTSGVSGIRTRVLKGDPSQAGLYTIQLEVPANTRIEAHAHPDDRAATVVSGTWYFGYGDHFEESGLNLVTPSSERAEAQQLRFAELAAAAGVRPVVKLSQYAAAEGSPVRFLRYHAVVERRIRELGLGYTFLRPNLFFQGLFAMAGMIREQGRFFAPIGEARVSAVDVRDIAAVACAALTEPGHDGRTYTVTGPEAVTHAQIALASGAAVGKDVAFVDVPTEAFAGALKGVLPEWQLSGLLEDYAHYARGEASAVLPTVKEVTGREPRDAATFARDNAAAFGGRSAD